VAIEKTAWTSAEPESNSGKHDERAFQQAAQHPSVVGTGLRSNIQEMSFSRWRANGAVNGAIMLRLNY
jgi:hypothetical protein